MAKIKVIEHHLHPTVVRRHRPEGDRCELIVRFKDPDTGRYRTASQITDIAWTGSAQTRDYAISVYGHDLIKRVEAILSGDIETPKDLSIIDYFGMWIRWREDICYHLRSDIKITTLRSNQYALNAIRPYFIKHPILLRRIRERHIEDFMSWMKDNGQSNNYIRDKISFLSLILDRAVKESYLESNPIKKIDRPRKDKTPEKVFYSADQLRLLLERAQGQEVEPLVYILVYCGCRIGEAIGLTWDCVDFDNSIIHIHQQVVDEISPNKADRYTTPKTDHSYRTLYMPAGMRDYLLQLRERQEQDRAYCGNSYREPSHDIIVRKWNGWELTKNQWRKKFQTFIEKQYDLPYITPHCLRHTFNSVLLDAKVPNKVRAALTGDTESVLHSTYDHVFESAKKAAMDTYDELIRGKDDHTSCIRTK